MAITNHPKRRLLFELFIVITIFVIAILFLVKFLEGGRESSRNMARVSQIQEYQKAFNVHYSDEGKYPFDKKQTPTCLGSYPEKKCWKDEKIMETDLIRNSVVPKYMPRIPEGETRKFGEYGSYKGMIYVPGVNGKSYKIFYFMEGSDQPCIINGATGINSGFDTLCSLNVS